MCYCHDYIVLKKEIYFLTLAKDLPLSFCQYWRTKFLATDGTGVTDVVISLLKTRIGWYTITAVLNTIPSVFTTANN